MMSGRFTEYVQKLPRADVDECSSLNETSSDDYCLINRKHSVKMTKLIIACQLIAVTTATFWQLPISVVGIPLALLVFGTAFYAMYCESGGYLLPLYIYLASQVIFSALFAIALVAISLIDYSAFLYIFGKAGDFSLLAKICNVAIACVSSGLVGCLSYWQMSIIGECRRYFLRKKEECLLFVHCEAATQTPPGLQYQAVGQGGQRGKKLPVETQQFSFD